ncbi:hypothetical protein CLV62_102168 [Dysgonomonas alginatilytica]|uniref:Uncharacterized protein n=1 Tax=Dysgonomonas alginatilytica TaxID=1605892 RepID=A0A2V3PUS2_9BACT|nr:hypothetical protein [Dysgonomonas alginatilytica]PXV68136.1 hypothetical protein CLV62_102168 [Dysgonomonas alginatilytica]
MKKKLLLFVLFSVFIVKAQENISFPASFKLNPKLLSGMVIAEIPAEYKKEGIINNPAVIEDTHAIRMMANSDNRDILQLYYEIYETKEEDDYGRDDAGVIVSRFVSEEALKNNLGELRNQSNLAYLVKNNYLIKVWSDASQNSEEHINGMVNYYQNSLQAELYQAAEQPGDTTEVVQIEFYEPADSTGISLW